MHFPRSLWLVLGLVVLGYLQARLWLMPGNYGDVADQELALLELKEANALQQRRNEDAEAWVRLLENDLPSIEYQARRELGMVRRGETFYLIVE